MYLGDPKNKNYSVIFLNLFYFTTLFFEIYNKKKKRESDADSAELGCSRKYKYLCSFFLLTMCVCVYVRLLQFCVVIL